MLLLWVIVIGFLVGLVARFFMPGAEPKGFVLTSLLGIAGSIAGSYTGQLLGWYMPGEPAGFLGSVLGAMLLLGIFNMVRKGRTA